MQRTRCNHCGYDLAGVRSLLCPECGERPYYIPVGFPLWLRTAAIISGWTAWSMCALAILLITVLILPAGAKSLQWLICPGVLLAVAALLFMPWFKTFRLLRAFPTVPDCLFVGLFPWVPGGLGLAVLWGFLAAWLGR